MTPFQFDHEFRARAPAVLFEAYFDAEQAAEQDALTGIERREVLDRVEDDATLRRVCRVVPRRQLPALVRPFVAGELSYREALVWTKAADRMELTIEPSLLGGRTEITSRYEVTAGPPGHVRRRYAGEVTVEVRLVGARIERAIVEDVARSLAIAAACTQRWLDRRGLAG